MTTPEQVENDWFIAEKGRPNFSKSKKCWNELIMQKLEEANSKTICRRAKTACPNYRCCKPSLSCKQYLVAPFIPDQMRLRMVTEQLRNTTCPLCKGTPQHNTAHYILGCDILSNERRILDKTLKANFNTALCEHTVYTPQSRPVQALIDDFLRLVNEREREILSEVNKNLMENPGGGINTVFDVQLDDHHYYRAEIVDYNSDSRQFTVDPGLWDNWPRNIAPVTDLNSIGTPDSFDLIPSCFALKFNPIDTPDNIGKFYRSRGKLKKVTDLRSLERDLRRGAINSCPHNGNVARRYVSALGASPMPKGME
jgi:hypothetical protein